MGKTFRLVLIFDDGDIVLRLHVQPKCWSRIVQHELGHIAGLYAIQRHLPFAEDMLDAILLAESKDVEMSRKNTSKFSKKDANTSSNKDEDVAYECEKMVKRNDEDVPCLSLNSPDAITTCKECIIQRRQLTGDEKKWKRDLMFFPQKHMSSTEVCVDVSFMTDVLEWVVLQSLTLGDDDPRPRFACNIGKWESDVLSSCHGHVHFYYTCVEQVRLKNAFPILDSSSSEPDFYAKEDFLELSGEGRSDATLSAVQTLASKIDNIENKLENIEKTMLTEEKIRVIFADVLALPALLKPSQA